MNHINRNEYFKNLAHLLSVYCVRNTVIEEYHEGITPCSKTGDYTDVKVVTPHGEIPWDEVSRISDKEMKAFNIQVVNRVYTFLQFILNDEQDKKKRDAFWEMISKHYPTDWDIPKLDEGIMKTMESYLSCS